MKIALTNMDIIWEDKSVNQDKCLELIKRASECGARLILFPEMTLTGFTMNPQKYGEKAGEDSETVKFFEHLSKEYAIAIGFGYIEKGEKDGFAKNHMAVVDAGKILGDYTKIHPFSYGEENEHYCGGDRLVTVSIDGVIFGLSICYDLRFPELYQAMRSCDAIAVIANWPKGRVAHWNTLLPARAVETQAYVLGVNRIGKDVSLDYEASTAAYDYDGSPLSVAYKATSYGDECLMIKIEPDHVRRWKKEFPAANDRKPALYASFLQKDV